MVRPDTNAGRRTEPVPQIDVFGSALVAEPTDGQEDVETHRQVRGVYVRVRPVAAKKMCVFVTPAIDVEVMGRGGVDVHHSSQRMQTLIETGNVSMNPVGADGRVGVHRQHGTCASTVGVETT